MFIVSRGHGEKMYYNMKYKDVLQYEVQRFFKAFGILNLALLLM
jgi:hypothetical protein